jgi:hypothetical protein
MCTRALVLYNAAAAALAVAPLNANPSLMVGGQQLAALYHNQLQQTVLAMPGRDVDFVRRSHYSAAACDSSAIVHQCLADPVSRGRRCKVVY